MSGIHQQGISNRLIYDNCSYDQYVKDTTGQYKYQFYQGAFENCNNCNNKIFKPFDLIDVESELKNQTRLNSKCGLKKYNNNTTNDKCEINNNNKVKCSLKGDLSTFDKSAPIVYPPYLCPIVHNNIPKTTNKGYFVPNYINCKKI